MYTRAAVGVIEAINMGQGATLRGATVPIFKTQMFTGTTSAEFQT